MPAHVLERPADLSLEVGRPSATLRAADIYAENQWTATHARRSYAQALGRPHGRGLSYEDDNAGASSPFHVKHAQFGHCFREDRHIISGVCVWRRSVG